MLSPFTDVLHIYLKGNKLLNLKSDHKLQTSDYRLQTTDNRLQTKDYRLQTTDYRLQTTGYIQTKN